MLTNATKERPQLVLIAVFYRSRDGRIILFCDRDSAALGELFVLKKPAVSHRRAIAHRFTDKSLLQAPRLSRAP
jgi:hypothetical protein